jgi:hypothetical protein
MIMKGDLEKLKQEIIDYLKKEDFVVFYGMELEIDKPLPEIRWSLEEGSWKDFLECARSEGIKLIVFDSLELTDEIIEENLNDEELQNIDDRLKSFKRHVGEIGELNLMWIKDGVKYTYREMSDWWSDFVPSVAAEPRERFGLGGAPEESITRDLKAKTSEELAKEMEQFIDREFKEAEEMSFHELARLFWTHKGLRYGYVDNPELTLKMRKTETMVERKLEQEKLRKEKDMLPKLVDECLKWSTSNSLRKVTKSNVDYFLTNKGVQMSKTSRDAIYNEVNLKLEKG